MSLRSWFRGSTAAPTSKNASAATSTSALGQAAEREISDIEASLNSADLIMNDDIEGAEAKLKLRKDDSTYHLLCYGVTMFMRSMLGFEKDVMTEAGNRLQECETRAWADLKRTQKSTGWFGSSTPAPAADAASQIYPPGTEYALVLAQSQLMNAVMAVMHENLTEGLRGFYKLRQAYKTLDGIMSDEARALQRHHGVTPGLTRRHTRQSLGEQSMPGSFDEKEFTDLREEEEDDGDEPSATKPKTEKDLEFLDAKEGQSGTQTPLQYNGHLGTAGTESSTRTATPTVEKSMAKLQITTQAIAKEGATGSPLTKTASRPGSRSEGPLSPGTLGGQGIDASIFSNAMDVFIHSGASMCFGVLLLILSMVPPAMSRLLAIIGFRGDRVRGVRMLWQSTKFANVNGAVAAFVLFVYYHSFLTFNDILPIERDIDEHADPDEIVGYPREKCSALLVQMKERYPASRLWTLEEARILASTRKLDEAIKVLEGSSESKMRQVTALNTFELSLNTLYTMQWARTRDAFLRCIELNDWSHTLYYYFAGTAEVEMYRDAFHLVASLGPDREAEKSEAESQMRLHKKAAEDLFRKAPTVAGRKRFMAKLMPFEIFVIRKISRLEERATALGVDLIDAAGVSPAMEMLYLWNGDKKMSMEQLESGLKLLSWDRCTIASELVEQMKSAPDESAIKGVCEGAILRNLGRVEEAKKTLEQEVLRHDRILFKGPTKDDYLKPVATYEMAVIAWREACDPVFYPKNPAEIEEFRREKVNKCQAYLEMVAKWEGFTLDARIGMKVQVGFDTIRWLKAKKNWA